MIDEQPPVDVEAFCYPGSSIDLDGGTTKEIKCRIGEAQAAFTTLGKDPSFYQQMFEKNFRTQVDR